MDFGLPGVPEPQPGAAQVGQVGAAIKALANLAAVDITARAGRSRGGLAASSPGSGSGGVSPHALLHVDGARV